MEEQVSTSGGNKNLILVVVAVIVIIALVAGGVFFYMKNKNQSSVQAPAAQNNGTNQIQPDTPDKSSNAGYKDGTYEAVGSYAYHSGTESIKVSVTLSSGVVKDVTVTPQAKNPVSKEKQADFIANYKEMVIGKNIDEVKLSKVSGSSLTPIGFNAALDDIKSQAKS